MLKQVNYSSSCIAWNDGKGKFSVQPLPLSAQLSSINAISAKDINNDGNKDILAAGNFFDLLPQFCSIDASYGNLLLGNGKGGFIVATPQQSGISINGQIKQVLPLQMKNQPGYLFLQNNQYPLYLRKTSAGKK